MDEPQFFQSPGFGLQVEVVQAQVSAVTYGHELLHILPLVPGAGRGPPWPPIQFNPRHPIPL